MFLVRPIRHTYTKKQRGFSLIELMISLFLGIVMTGIVYQLFLSAHTANKVINNLSELQETGRFALGIVTKDLQRAGYYGGNADIELIRGTVGYTTPATPTCLSAGNSWATMLEQHLFGINDSKLGYQCIADDDYLRGDVLTIRYVSPWLVPVSDFLDNELYLRASLFEGKIFNGIDQANTDNDVTRAEQTEHRLIAHSFFIGPSAQSCDGSAIPALYWQTIRQGLPAKEELLSGVENMQFEYGVDLTGDSSPNQYLDANDVTDWNIVATVRVSMLVRSSCADPSYSHQKSYAIGDITYEPRDNYHRQLFSTTITLRNTKNNS